MGCGASDSCNAAGAGSVSDRAIVILHLLLLSLLGVACYSNSFHTPFVFDDISSIVDNPVVKDIPSFLSGAGYAYNPRRFVGYLTFALNYGVGGLDSFGYHLVNLAIHILAGWLVYLLVRLTLRTPFCAGAGPGNHLGLLPLVAAVLFIVHPVQTQAVTYLVQRLASLTALFYLLSLVCYLKGRLAHCAGAGGVRAWLFFAAAILSALFAVHTKEIAATLPLAVLLLELSFFPGGRKRNLALAAALLFFVLAVCAAVFAAGKPLGELLSDVNEMSRETSTIPRWAYLLTQFSVIATYLRLLLLPVHQNLDYDYPVYHSFSEPRVLLSLLFLSALVALALLLYRRTSPALRHLPKPGAEVCPHYRLIAFGILWFFITLGVESSVIPISDVIFEHRLYLPAVGAFTAFASGALLLLKRFPPQAVYAGTALVALVLGTATWQRNLVWASEVSLWGDVVSKSPEKSRANDHYGVALYKVGRTEEAFRYLSKSLEINSRNWYALYNLGRVFDDAGNIDAAIGCYEGAVSLNTGLAEGHHNLAVDYLLKGEDDRALASCQAALRVKPDFPQAHNSMGFLLTRKGRVDEAIGHYLAAVKGNGGYAKAYNNLGLAYLAKGEPDLAIAQFERALSLSPGDAAAGENLATAMRLKQGGR